MRRRAAARRGTKGTGGSILAWLGKLFGRGNRDSGGAATTQEKPKVSDNEGGTALRPEGAPAAPAPRQVAADFSSFQAGDVIAEAYEVRQVLAGGMGVVYIARHREWQMDVAVKVPYRRRIPLPAHLGGTHA